jgi:Nuclear transport factor 2 (NTF2) domain
VTGRAESALLAAVERSPEAAAAHDRAGWVGLFTVDGRIEDPVGSRSHVGQAQIGRFYDTFIGPRDIAFDRVGSRRKQLVDSFVNAIGRGDRLAAQRALSSNATMTFGDDDVADIADLVALCPGARAPKLIAAGSTVAASIASTQGCGVMFADVARRRNEIRRIRYFPG